MKPYFMIGACCTLGLDFIAIMVDKPLIQSDPFGHWTLLAMSAIFALLAIATKGEK